MAADVVITTNDGARLAGTLYLPDGDGPFAALLEALRAGRTPTAVRRTTGHLCSAIR